MILSHVASQIPKPLTHEGASLLVSSFVVPRIIEESAGSLILATAADQIEGGIAAEDHISSNEPNEMLTRRVEQAQSHPS